MPKNTLPAKSSEVTEVAVSKSSKSHTELSGSVVEEFTHLLTNQVFKTLWRKHSDQEEKNKQYTAVLAAMSGIKPKDEIEGMLAAQMIGLHNAALECMRRAMLPEQTFEGRKESLSQANKLTRSYSTLVEALNRYRGKSTSQKVTVEHVHVYEGGQAIVGSVERGQ